MQEQLTLVPPNEWKGVRYWGDGKHDDTAALQAWLDMVTDNGNPHPPYVVPPAQAWLDKVMESNPTCVKCGKPFPCPERGQTGHGEIIYPDPPAQTHSSTSVAAANEIKRKTPALREMVYATLVTYPGTDEDIAERLNLSQNTTRPRRVELVRAGRVEAVNRKRTKAGRMAVVWGPSVV